MGLAYKISRYAVVSEAFCEPGGSKPLRILFSTRSGTRLVVSDKTWSALSADPSSNLEPSLREALITARILVPDSEDELAVVLAENKEVQTTTRSLDYVLQPTAACQLGCDYCGQAHSPKTLSEEDLQSILERIERMLSGGRFEA